MEVTPRFDARDAAFDVRKRVFMDEQGYENEFDQIDDDPRCIHVTLYVDGEVAGCSRVFPEELERTAAPEAPKSPVCELDEGVEASQTYLLGRVAVLGEYRRRGLASEIVRASDDAARRRCSFGQAACAGVRTRLVREVGIRPDLRRGL